MAPNVRYTILSPLLGGSIPLPEAATEGAAAVDLRACVETQITIPAGGRALIPAGFAVAIPEGMAGLVFARSGLAIKQGICLANGVGLIDSDYRGEIMVGLLNTSDEPFAVNPGDRVAQLAFTRFESARMEPAESLDDTTRGAGGFGSTGLG